MSWKEVYCGKKVTNLKKNKLFGGQLEARKL